MKISIFSNKSIKTQQIEDLIRNEAFKYDLEFDDENPDILFYIGGDGTFLRAVQSNIDRLDSILFVGINKGTLGYFYDATEDDIEDIFNRLAANALIEHRIPLLMGKASNENEEVEFYAVNEILINRIGGTIFSDVFINDAFFEHYVGSGLLLCSSYGSSGLNKSLNGPIIKNYLRCNCLTPIAPISNAVYKSFTSPLVLSSNDVVSIRGGINNATICFDNVVLEDSFTSLDIIPSKSYVRVLYRENRDDLYPLRKSFL